MVSESTSPGIPCLKEPFLSDSWSFGKIECSGMRCPQRGLSIKQLASLDMIVLSSPSLDSGKRSVSLWFQRKEANEPFTGNLSALLLRLLGGPVPSLLWLFRRAAMVAGGWKFKQSQAF